MHDRDGITLAAADVQQERFDARKQVGRSFAAERREGCARACLLERIRAVARKNLLARQALPAAPIVLGEPRIDLNVAQAQELSRLSRALQRTLISTRVGEALWRRELCHLRAALIAQRRVERSLDAAFRIPHRRPVA